MRKAKKQVVKKKKPAKPAKIDGLGPETVKRVRIAIRQVWHWSHAKRLVVKRCTLLNGFSRCEQCKRTVAKIHVDHIQRVGDVDAGFLTRMFCPSTQLQGLCKRCHDAKTKQERDDQRELEKDFY